MPEGPEIRVICDYLNKVWKYKIILNIVWDEKSKFSKPKHKIKNIELSKYPCRVLGVYPRGKVIIIECINRDKDIIYITSQLGMEGKWVHERGNHSNLVIYFGDLDESKTKYEILDTWYFDDSRHFGHFNIYKDTSVIEKSHGPCLLTAALVKYGHIEGKSLKTFQPLASLDVFTSKMKNRRMKSDKRICDFLMEQKYVSGIGNYLRAEILYRCHIHPHKIVHSFTDEQIKGLYNWILYQMKLSYGSKGLTIKSYWDPEGNKGICPLQVYNQETDPHGNQVHKIKDKQNRTIHWVPAVQRIV